MNWTSSVRSEIAFGVMIVIKVTVVLGLSWLVAALLGHQSAAKRHRIWIAGVLGALMLPLLIVIVPRQYSGPVGDIAGRWVSRIGNTSQAIPAVLPATRTHTMASSSDDVGLYLLLAAWSTVVLVLGLRLVAGLRRLARIGESSSPVTGEDWSCLLGELSKHLGTTRPVQLLLSCSPAFIPVTWGVFRPRIILPSNAGQWPERRRRIVLAHELAHINRGDWLTQMCAEFMCCVYWFHPLAWIAARKLRNESERACDDAVLSTSVSPSDYARELLELIQSLGTVGNTRAVALAIVRPSDLERRFEAMLVTSVDRSRLSKKAKLLVALFTLLLVVPLAAFRLTAPMRPSTPPEGWFLAGTVPQNYLTGVDRMVTYQDHASAYLKSKALDTGGFGTLMQGFHASKYIHQRIRFSADVKSEGVTDWAGLWMRVDGGPNILAFDNMYNRRIKGTTGWQNYSVVLDVPDDASGISFGILLTQGGTVWLSDVKFETVGTDVPTTAAPFPSIQEGPRNLNFEN